MHIPVLQKEVLKFLDPKPNQDFIDATVGEGGHALSILERNGPKGRVLGIDRDPEIIQRLERMIYEERLTLTCANFAELEKVIEKFNFEEPSGILFDFGFCSWHVEESDKGFTFQENQKLDMRYNPKQQQLTAKEILNQWDRKKIEKIIREYGEEKYSEKIAKEIIKERKNRVINSTLQLVEIIKRAVPGEYRKGRINCATRTFQALRIAVNDELENIKQGLEKALKVVEHRGNIVTISFHSLEDKIVKNFFEKKEQREQLKILNEEPVTPTPEEVESNPRSRSAKLRAAKKIAYK